MKHTDIYQNNNNNAHLEWEMNSSSVFLHAFIPFSRYGRLAITNAIILLLVNILVMEFSKTSAKEFLK